MVEPALYAAFGACFATLLLLLFLPALWRRAVRLTTKRLAGKLPISMSEIVAAQDRLRAEHAMATRSVERRAEIMQADGARERIAAGTVRAHELGLRAEMSALQDSIRALEASGAVVRSDLDRTGAEFAETTKALEAAKAEAQAAVRERDVARKAMAAAEVAADSLRIDLATAEAALASSHADVSENEKRLAKAGETLSAKDAHEQQVAELLRTETAKLADANAARLAAEKNLVDETANVVALRAEMARTPPAPRAIVDETADETLAALRARLDEVADEIVRASSAPAPRAPKASGTARAKLQPSHVGA